MELKHNIEVNYNTVLNNFNENDLFRFPNFKSYGNYRDLKFNPIYNKSLTIF